MLIRVVCPRCNASYQVQQELCGKAMRCPAPTCQKVFLIGEAPTATKPTTRSDPPAGQSGNVGDLVPLLPTEPEAPAGPDLVPVLPSEAAAPSWRDAPPARRGPDDRQAVPPPAEPQTRTRKAPPATAAKKNSSGPVVKEVGDWAAPPPVRRGQTDETPYASETPDEPRPVAVTDESPVEPAHRPPTSLAKWIIIPFLLLTVLGLGGGGVYVWWIFTIREGYLAGEAAKAYDAGLFHTAASDYAQIAKLYPDSEKAKFYQFRADLAKLREGAKKASGEGVGGQVAAFADFLNARANDPLLNEHAADVGESLVQMTKKYAEEAAAEAEPTDEALDVIKQARAAIDQAKAVKDTSGKPAPDWARADEAFVTLSGAVARASERRQVFARLDELKAKGSYAALLAAQELLAGKAEKLPELAGDPRTQKAVAAIYRSHLESIKFVSPSADRTAARPEETEPAILLDPLVAGTAGKPQRGTPVALALARGVLYGLDRDTGRIRWAMRVGIDTTGLPARVPAGDGNRERILALSSDTRTLTALDSDGVVLWRHVMSQPCLGRPVVVDKRLLATLDGGVHEIELIQGKLVGTYKLGQRLTLGGTLEPTRGLVYFPADDGCVYVINARQRTCEAILYSRHPAGSLRGEVILVSPEGEDAPGYLILPQASGLDAVQMRVFALPIKNDLGTPPRLAEQVKVEPEARLDGWTWFRPYYDPEKLVMLSDAGVLGLFGIRQTRNRDQALFPILPGGGRRVGKLLGEDGELPSQRGRAEVVKLEGDDLWVLASNRVGRLRMAWDREVGPRLTTVWPRAQVVGSPLHSGQSFEDRLGQTNLVVVTQPPRRPACWATCLNDEKGNLLWRRQLGVVCESEPLPLNAPGGKAPILLLLDQSGSLFSLDPTRFKVTAETEWSTESSDQQLAPLAGGLDENPDQPPVVLRIDESSAYVIACPGDGKELVVRHVKAVALPKGKQGLVVDEQRVPLPSPLAGTPAVVGAQLIFPLANERLGRVPLPIPAKATVQQGPSWKSLRAEPEARGHVVALGGNRFVTTDGIRELRVWDWPAGNAIWKVVPATRGNRPTIALSDRIVSMVPLPGKASRLVVADKAGVLHLLESQANGALEEKRTWSMDGPVVSGPFVEMVGKAVRVGCVGRGKLVWIDPDKDGVKWTHKTDAKVVGRPRLAAGMVVVATVTDKEGRYVGLDPETGKPAGAGHKLTGTIAPASGASVFHDDRLLAPLSDGTLLMLAVKRLKGK